MPFGKTAFGHVAGVFANGLESSAAGGDVCCGGGGGGSDRGRHDGVAQRP